MSPKCSPSPNRHCDSRAHRRNVVFWVAVCYREKAQRASRCYVSRCCVSFNLAVPTDLGFSEGLMSLWGTGGRVWGLGSRAAGSPESSSYSKTINKCLVASGSVIQKTRLNQWSVETDRALYPCWLWRLVRLRCSPLRQPAATQSHVRAAGRECPVSPHPRRSGGKKARPPLPSLTGTPTASYTTQVVPMIGSNVTVVMAPL